MLQEIFLSLSGIPSPIWEDLNDNKGKDGGLRLYVSAPEQAMLKTLSDISRTHIETRDLAAALATKHQSLVCRAVCTAIGQVHLTAYRKRVLEVEASILCKDASHVGGYDIVPLSTLVTDFTPWLRRLGWLRDVVHFIKGANSKDSVKFCHAAIILEYLDSARCTGFSDVEDVAIQLLVVAQRTWVKALSSWILYGQLPSFAKNDFLVQTVSSKGPHAQYVLNSSFTPSIVSTKAAESILAVGNALQLLQSSSYESHDSIPQNTAADLLTSNLAQLKLLQFPLNVSLFESAMLSIDKSMSYCALSAILPRQTVLQFCEMLHDYMLLKRGEFAVTLVENSDARIHARQKVHTVPRPVRKLGRLDDMSLKESEMDSILSQTWSDLATLTSCDEKEDDVLALATKLLKLKPLDLEKADGNGPVLSTLLPVPATIQLDIPASSPLLLFISESSTRRYSRINEFLLSLRRSQMRLSSLWKLTSQRRCHPPPLGPPLSTTAFGLKACRQRRARETIRSLKMRKYWSVMSKSLFLLNELNAYLHGEVIDNSWRQFERWMMGLEESNGEQISNAEELVLDLRDKSKMDTPTSIPYVKGLSSQNIESRSNGDTYNHYIKGSVLAPYDPRILAQAHTIYLSRLSSALLLHHASMTSTLKTFFELIDHFVALFARITTIWEGLDLQEDEGVMDAFANYAQDETEVLAEMERARIEVESLLEEIVKHIREIEVTQRRQRETQGTVLDSHETLAVGAVGDDVLRDGVGESGGFVPWRVKTLDPLVMKVDWLCGKGEEPEDDLITQDDYD